MLTLVPVRIEQNELSKIKNPIFLGTWAFEKGDIEGIINNIPYIPYTYDNYDSLKEDYLYSIELYEKFITIFNDFFNEKFDLNWNIKSTKLFCGLWVLEFIQVVLEKYRLLDSAFLTKQIEKIVLTDTLYEVKDYEDFNSKIQVDSYNHILISKIVKHMDNKLFQNSYIVDHIIEKIQISNNSKKVIIMKNLQVFFNKITKKTATLFDRSYFDNNSLLKLFFLNYPNIRPLIYIPKNESLASKNLDLRNKLKNSFKEFEFNNSSFEKILISVLVDEIPLSYLENFTEILKVSQNIKFSGNVYSANNLFMNDTFKCAVANNLSSINQKLIIGQHGGSYGIAQWNTREFWERDVSDKYITFGWGDTDGLLPLSHPKLLRKISKKIDQLKIMYIATNNPRYMMTNWSNPIAGRFKINYYKNIKSVISRLNNNIKDKFFLRLHPNDFGIGLIDYLQDPTINFSTGNFYEEMENSSLIVCDHNQTSYLESMAMDIPTIVFWNKDDWKLRDETKSYFEKLEEKGVFFSSIDEVLVFLNFLDGFDINTWWNEPSRKQVVNQFINRYAKKNTNWLSDYGKNIK